MVLIGHDPVEADLIGPGILLMILVIQRVRLPGIEIPVGKVETPGGVLGQVRLLHRRVGLLGMKEDFHLLLHQSLLGAY
jgi:hypothetical protein